MSLSRATLVQRIRYELGDRPWEDPSCSAASASSTITGASTGDWAEGDIGEFLEDGDTFYVRSEAGGTITATRSYWGSTGASHTNARVLKNPRYTFTEIVNAISATIQGKLVYPRVYKKVSDTITPDPGGTVWYDLAADALGLIDVRQLYGTSDTKEARYGERHDARKVILRRNMTTSLVTSGVGLRFPGGFFHESNTVNVDYAAKITDTISGSDYADITDGEAIVEAIIYGTVAHLEAALENRKPRKPRHDRETLRGASLYDNLFDEALARAEKELRAQMPLMPELSHG